MFRMIVRGDLGLYPCLDHIQWTGYNTRKTARGNCSQHLQPKANIILSGPLLCEFALLFVKCELQGGKWEVSHNRGLVSRIKRSKPFCSRYCLGRIPGRFIVVSRIEEGIVVSSLELQSGLEDFGGDIDNRRCEIGEKTWSSLAVESFARKTGDHTTCKVCKRRAHASIEHMSLAVFI